MKIITKDLVYELHTIPVVNEQVPNRYLVGYSYKQLGISYFDMIIPLIWARKINYDHLVIGMYLSQSVPKN